MVKLNDITIDNNSRLTLLAGPCVVESRDVTFRVAEKVKTITGKLGIPYVFKASYKKANRTSIDSFTGIGDDEALKILAEVKKEFDLPIVTDIHTPEEAAAAAEIADILQIPAFLCRQTDLLVAAGKTGRIVNIKKGQFLSPYNMKQAAGKVSSTGNNNILFTERGTTFGYSDLVVDMRGLKIMADSGYPVVLDATHSVQSPGTGNITGGKPEFIPVITRAGVAAGIAALFLEVHPEPAKALSDAASQFPVDELEGLLNTVIKIDDIVKNR